MTTAARPTWAPAKGHEEQGGVRHFAPSQRVSAKDLAMQTALKTRVDGQSTAADLAKKDLRMELEEKERQHFTQKSHREEGTARLLEPPPARAPGRLGGTKELLPRAADADDSDGDAGGAGGADSDSESGSDEDDTAALLAELEKIKRERADDAARKAAVSAAVAAATTAAELAGGNPLVPLGGSFAVKRRWDEDVVFKHQARGEPAAVKRFVNDTIRSDFHRKFLNRYIK